MSRGLDGKFLREYHFDEEFFKEITDESKAYWFGFILADGHVGERQLSVRLSSRDSDHLQKLADIFKVSIKLRRSNSTASLDLHSKVLCQSLRDKGLTSNKTFDINYRDVIEYIPDSLFNHFVRGVFDGDGCAYIGVDSRTSKTYIAPKATIVGNINFILGLAIDINKFIKINTSLQKTKNKMIVTLEVQGIGNVSKLRDFLYKDASLLLDRKKSILESIREYKPRKKKILYDVRVY